MKVRSGFVSNSSSSSFVISAKKGETLKVRIEIDLFSHNIIETERELQEYFLNEHGGPDDTFEHLLENFNEEYIIKQYEEYLAEIKKGNCIYIGSVSNQDSGEDLFLYDHGIGDCLVNEGAKVIQDCEGG